MRGSGAAVFDDLSRPPSEPTLGPRLIHADAEGGSAWIGFTALKAFRNPGAKV
jgi:hypothetical protein